MGKEENLPKWTKQLYQKKGEGIRDWKFLLKLPVSLKSCSKWGLQYRTPSIEE